MLIIKKEEIQKGIKDEHLLSFHYPELTTDILIFIFSDSFPLPCPLTFPSLYIIKRAIL